MGGVLARVLQELTSQEPYTYDYLVLNDDDLIRVTLELGQKFSTSRAWRNLHDWAYFKQRQEEGRR